MKTSFALALTALVLVPAAALAGDSSASGNTTITTSVTATIGGTGPGGQPIGSCVPTTSSSC